MAPLRHDPTVRRQRLDTRVSALKRRFGIASVLGFGAIFGLVTQHAVGSQKHKTVRVTQTVTTTRAATTFFDANGAGYSFDDSGARAAAQQQAQQSAAAAQQQAQSQQSQPQAVAQSSGS
jgi:hypothetical protein